MISALRCVTKLYENKNYDDFIDRVKKNPLAVAVKINDLTDNFSRKNSAIITRMKKLGI